MKVRGKPQTTVHQQHSTKEIQQALTDIMEKYGLTINYQDFDDYAEYALVKRSHKQSSFYISTDDIFQGIL